MFNHHKTLLGLFGNPVGHSLSPLMQNSAINKMELPFVYLPFKIERQDLKVAVSAIRTLHMGGVNVTIPFKEEIIAYLDELSPSAQACGAVNLVKNNDGHLIGYNTDGLGFVRSLAEEKISPRGRILFIGAGGAARALAYEISRANVGHMDFMDIDENRAGNLADFIKMENRCSSSGLAMNDMAFEEYSSQADLIINCTAVGMFPRGDDCPVKSLKSCKRDAIICDLVYNPIRTRFLSMAQEMGLRTHGGLSMLVHQGALSLEILTGCTAPVAYMKEVVFDYYEKQAGLHTS